MFPYMAGLLPAKNLRPIKDTFYLCDRVNKQAKNLDK